MNKYHSEENTLQRVANIIGMDLVRAEIDGEPCFALTDYEDHDRILFGPMYDNELVDLDGAAEHLIEVLAEIEPDEISARQIYRVLERDEYGDWAVVYALTEILTLCDDFNTDFFNETGEAASEQVILTLIGIVTDILRGGIGQE